MPHAAIPFRPHHRFAVPLPRSRRGGLVTRRFLAESRNISFPRRCGGSGERSEPIGALIPHAALWVVQLERTAEISNRLRRFNAARGFVGGAALDNIGLDTDSMVFQCRTRLCGWCSRCVLALCGGFRVSMPYAALWVVQPISGCRWRTAHGVSMPHAALWVVQPGRRLHRVHVIWVSMPHAALWVVQPRTLTLHSGDVGFNAARGFVGGAAMCRAPCR